ncbi:pilus assembly protein HofM, partial [Serratia rubidaea]|nr:pilus assembly protein HofM [Serratia rubidaea]
PEIGDAERALAAVLAANAGAQTLYYSSVLDEPAPEGALLWSPLEAFPYRQAPLPAKPGAFVLAGGLALRQEDC